MVWIALTLCSLFVIVLGNPDAKRLYDDLLSTYNRLIRPVDNNAENVTVKLGVRLSQLLELNLKDQILTTNLWVEHEWTDAKFVWDPSEYGGVDELYVPSEHIWLPDIVVYNNADGEYVITTMTKAVLHFDGRVTWTPPAIFKTYCEIDVAYFPFDKQTCFMKFGSWTYDGYLVDLRHINQTKDDESDGYVELGMDLTEYFPSVEWDILSVPAKRNVRIYPCCEEPYPDIYFNITLRRKTLFYTVNLIIPSVGLNYLSVLVFYLPADSGEKVMLTISVLLSQTMFFLLISEIIPPTSLAVPLLGKYLLFTMFIVGLSVLVTIIILNVHFRKPSTHTMSPWVRRWFLLYFPKFLFMIPPMPTANRPVFSHRNGVSQKSKHRKRLPLSKWGDIPPPPPPPGTKPPLDLPSNGCPDLTTAFELFPGKQYPVQILRAIENVRYIQSHLVQDDRFKAEDEDWGYVAMVLDRFFLNLFCLVACVGTFVILLNAPSLFDYSVPVDIKYSKFARFVYGISELDDDLCTSS